MTKPKIFLAVAGAGKTYTICNSLSENKRNLLLTFTHENVFNLTSELIKRFGRIPDNTHISTFDSFLLNNFIWPNYSLIQKEYFKLEPKSNKNISLVRCGFNQKNFRQNSKIDFCHYFIKENNCLILKLDTVSDLIMEKRLSFTRGNTIFDIGVNRLKKFYDAIYIDEFQDYRDSDFDLIINLGINFKNCFYYGDYYQHSVSGQNNSGRPFTKKVNETIFINNLSKMGFDVDKKLLSKSRRCSQEVCNFITKNLNINIESDLSLERFGVIEYIFDSDKLLKVIQSEKPIILSLNNNKDWNSKSFGITKGDTFNSTVVVVPDANLEIEKSGNIHIKKNIESEISKNKLYVGLTRSCGNVYITNKKTMDKIFQKRNKEIV